MTRTISAKQARDHFSDLLGSVHYGKQPVVVEKQGKPFAVVISPEDFARLCKIALDDVASVVEQIHEENKTLDPDEVYQEVTDVVEQVRQEMYEQHEHPPNRH
ncbi:MAG: type II toxin-antitoxin system Phd/YefM family antitoxin [Chloroflexi bacterium]|nr:type II toxin-antitoxin system Phd/YefM family antitoxin [Chloroflexota bacterium]